MKEEYIKLIMKLLECATDEQAGLIWLALTHIIRK